MEPPVREVPTPMMGPPPLVEEPRPEVPPEVLVVALGSQNAELDALQPVLIDVPVVDP